MGNANFNQETPIITSSTSSTSVYEPPTPVIAICRQLADSIDWSGESPIIEQQVLAELYNECDAINYRPLKINKITIDGKDYNYDVSCIIMFKQENYNFDAYFCTIKAVNKINGIIVTKIIYAESVEEKTPEVFIGNDGTQLNMTKILGMMPSLLTEMSPVMDNYREGIITEQELGDKFRNKNREFAKSLNPELYAHPDYNPDNNPDNEMVSNFMSKTFGLLGKAVKNPEDLNLQEMYKMLREMNTIEQECGGEDDEEKDEEEDEDEQEEKDDKEKEDGEDEDATEELKQ